jgi:hypothetical protein
VTARGRHRFGVSSRAPPRRCDFRLPWKQPPCLLVHDARRRRRPAWLVPPRKPCATCGSDGPSARDACSSSALKSYRSTRSATGGSRALARSTRGPESRGGRCAARKQERRDLRRGGSIGGAVAWSFARGGARVLLADRTQAFTNARGDEQRPEAAEPVRKEGISCTYALARAAQTQAWSPVPGRAAGSSPTTDLDVAPSPPRRPPVSMSPAPTPTAESENVPVW